MLNNIGLTGLFLLLVFAVLMLVFFVYLFWLLIRWFRAGVINAEKRDKSS